MPPVPSFKFLVDFLFTALICPSTKSYFPPVISRIDKVPPPSSSSWWNRWEINSIRLGSVPILTMHKIINSGSINFSISICWNNWDACSFSPGSSTHTERHSRSKMRPLTFQSKFLKHNQFFCCHWFVDSCLGSFQISLITHPSGHFCHRNSHDGNSHHGEDRSHAKHPMYSNHQEFSTIHPYSMCQWQSIGLL